MHFPKLLSYLSVLSVGIISTVSETHARPLVSRDGGDPVSIGPTPGSLINATLTADALLLSLIEMGLDDTQLLSNTSDSSDALALLDEQLLLLQWFERTGDRFDDNTINAALQTFDNCAFSFPVDDAPSFGELLVYITGAVSAGVQGYAVGILNNLELDTNQASIVLNLPVILAGLQLIANQALFGPTGSVQGYVAPLFTPYETARALSPFSGNCSLDFLDPTEQSTAFSGVPPVVLVSDSNQPLSPPLVFPVNTTLNIDTTLLRDSDNCKPDAPGLSCQIIALQDGTLFGAASVTVLPVNQCNVTVPGVNVIYVTSDDTTLPTDLADRVTMPIDTICAGSTYVYVHSSMASQL